MKKHIYFPAALFLSHLSFSPAYAFPPSADFTTEKKEASSQSTAQEKEILSDIGKACSSEKGAAIAEQFYANLLKDKTDTFTGKFNYASQQGGVQAGRLAMAIGKCFKTFYEEGSYNALTLQLQHIASRHAQLNIQAEEYLSIGDAFIKTLKDHGVLTNDTEIKVVENAYTELAEILKGLEEKIYDRAKNTENAWTGEKLLTLSNKETCGDYVTWTLKPADEGPLTVPPPGSSITLMDKVEISGRTILQMRPYTPYITKGDLRITVKNIGLFSEHLFKANEGTTIKAFSPVGTYEDQFPNPESGEAILLTAGSGITEAFSIIPSLEKQGIKTFFIHTTQNQDNDLSQTINSTSLLEKYVFYTQSNQTNDSSENISFGRIKEDKLKNILQDIHWKESRFFICGPKGFTEQMTKYLKNLYTDSQIITQGR